MSWAFTFDIPGPPPSTNNAYRIVIIRRGGAPFRTLAKTSRAVEYQDMARLLALDAINKTGPVLVPAGEYVRVEIAFFLKRHQDTDNARKFINDAIKSVLKVDDRWFLGTDLEKKVGKTIEPHCLVIVRYPA